MKWITHKKINSNWCYFVCCSHQALTLDSLNLILDMVLGARLHMAALAIKRAVTGEPQINEDRKSLESESVKTESVASPNQVLLNVYEPLSATGAQSDRSIEVSSLTAPRRRFGGSSECQKITF